jgi:hypothetical protein
VHVQGNGRLCPASAANTIERSQDALRYQARERSATGVEKFRGVSLYVGSSAVAVVLLVVLVLMIL